MKTLTLILAGTFFLNSCGDSEKAEKNKEDLDYFLKITALEIYRQGQELDSLNKEYDLLDKKSDTIMDF